MELAEVESSGVVTAPATVVPQTDVGTSSEMAESSGPNNVEASSEGSECSGNIEHYKTVLRIGYDVLVTCMKPDPVLDYLCGKETLMLQYQNIMELQLTSDKNRELLKRMQSRDETSYKIFKDALTSTGQTLLVRYLECIEKKEDTEDLEKELKDLTQSCQKRDVNYEHQLDLQLALENRLRDQLERIEKLRHSVLNLDTKTIAEIKTYSNPPDGVIMSIMATFILLGNTPKEVRNWRTCQALVGKTGKESLMRRISSFDPKDCSLAVAQMAKHMIENYSMSQIRDVSAGAATFFGWSLGMIEEIESTSGSGVGIVSKAPTKQERPKTNRSTRKR